MKGLIGEVSIKLVIQTKLLLRVKAIAIKLSWDSKYKLGLS